MIKSSEINTLETRSSFRTSDLSAAISSNEPLLFKPSDISDNDLWSRGRAVYDLRLYGTLINREKACVRLTNVPIYFDFDISAYNPEWRLSPTQLATQSGANAGANALARIELDGIARMRALLTEYDLASYISSLNAAWQYPMHGFTLEKHLYIRVGFSSLQSRGRCLKSLREATLMMTAQHPNLLAHDDSGFNSPAYFNTVARDYHFATAGWNLIRKYSHSCITKQDSRGQPSGMLHEFTLSVTDIVLAPPQQTFERLHDGTLFESWDIEVEHDTESGNIPNVGDNYTITTISLVYAYAWSEKPLVCYVLSIYPCDPTKLAADPTAPRTVFIICRDEADMLVTRARIAQRMLPDIRIAFNGANFDWKLYNDKVNRYGLCGEILQCMDLTSKSYASSESSPARAENEHYVRDAYKRRFTQLRVKISAENTHECACVSLMAGTLDIDIMPAMRRIFKNEEVKFAQSLNKYLEKARLPPKNDIYFKIMNKMLQRARFLNDPKVPRTCHCGGIAPICGSASSSSSIECPLCSGGTSCHRVREIDYAPVDPSAPMHTWTYYDGRDGQEPRLRDPRLAKCCACGMRPINEADIGQINDYCGIDSVRPLQLLRKLGVITDNCELANTTFTSLFDAFYRADGMRVVNFIGSFAADFGLAITSRAPERPKARFQGAHVFNPILGRHERPVTALDFSSLYPSLILAYNISPDMIITSQEAADALQRMGYELHRIESFEYEEGERTGGTFGSKSASQSASITKRTTHGWSVRHGGVLAPWGVKGAVVSTERPTTIHYDADDKEIRGRPALDREHLGLFGFALRYLLDARKAVRAEQGRIDGQIKAIFAKLTGAPVGSIEIDMAGIEGQAEKIYAQAASCSKSDGASSSNAPAGPSDSVRNEVTELVLRWRCLESKQKALKVLANTFYGQMGANISPCYTLIGAAGVTAAGRYNITRVAAMLIELGYTICYGDTDSVYTEAPERIYAEIDALWRKHGTSPGCAGEAPIMSLEEYWGRQVVAARADMDQLRLRVSAFLRADNGTRFLNMAYEEVGMPSALFGKKKYILRPHIKGVTFNARPMVRGLETVKQGRAKIVKMVGDEIIEDILALREGKDIIGIVTRQIERYYSAASRELDLAQFIQYKTYKPTKKNVMVNRFVERMQERYNNLLRTEGAAAAAPYLPPEAGDKFPYVVTERAAEITLGGHCVSFKVGDKMEYPFAVTSGRAQIDRRHYMEGALMSLFARFVSSDERFDPAHDPNAPHFNPDADYTTYDAWRQDKAVRFLSEICARYATTDMSHVRAVASRQRSVTGAFCSVVQQAAREVDMFIDIRVARLLINDQMREIVGSTSGGRVSDEMVQSLMDLICETALQKTNETTISDAEAIERYANSLESTYSPSELATRYSREYYTRYIISGLVTERDRILSEIKMDFAAPLIAMYRRKHIDEVLSGIATNAVENGTKGKAKLMPEVGRIMAIDRKMLDLLYELGRRMSAFATVTAELNREALMRKRFATDNGVKK